MSEQLPARNPRPLAVGLTLAVSALLAAGAAAPASAAVMPYETVTLVADPASVEVGDAVTVTVAATGLVDAYAYDLDIEVDPALLEYVDGSAVGPDGGFLSAASEDGAVTVVGTRLGSSPGLTGDQALVTLTFTALAAGEAEISLISGSFSNSGGAITTIDTTAASLSATVEIAAVDDAGTDSDADSDAGSDAAADGTGGSDAEGSAGSGGGSTPAEGENTDGSLATTGADAAPWLLVGGAAIVAAAIGSVLVLRRRTR